jgi:hypothetical protein
MAETLCHEACAECAAQAVEVFLASVPVLLAVCPLVPLVEDGFIWRFFLGWVVLNLSLRRLLGLLKARGARLEDSVHAAWKTGRSVQQLAFRLRSSRPLRQEVTSDRRCDDLPARWGAGSMVLPSRRRAFHRLWPYRRRTLDWIILFLIYHRAGGTTTSNDDTGPSIISYSPALGADSVDKDAVITLTFAEIVQRGDGTVSLTPSSWTWPNGTLAEESVEPLNIPISDPAQVVLTGKAVIIDPFASFLTGGEEYKVTFPHGGVKDTQGNKFAGIHGNFYTFKTLDIIAPSIVGYEPLQGWNGFGFPDDGDPIILTFNELVQAGDPNGASLIATVGSAVFSLTFSSVSGKRVTLDPLAALSPGYTYQFQLSADSIRDLAGNSFPGILDTSYMITVADPQSQSLDCTLGLACALIMSGSGLQLHNRIRWLQGSCGAATCADASTSPMPFHPESDAKTYNFGTITDTLPGQYSMCWASLGQSRVIAQGSEILTCEEYYFTAGSVSLYGPSNLVVVGATTSTAPAAGRSFSIEVKGSGLASTNRIRIVEYNVLCGLPLASTTTSGLVAGSTAAAGSLVLTTSMTWSSLVLRLPGMYRVCWCSGAVYQDDCDTDAEFNVDVGTFNVSGPYALQDTTGVPLAYDCGFEDLTSSGCIIWDQLNKSDNLQWSRHSGSTPSASTGPSSAKEGSYYMYLEASDSDVTQGHQAYLSASRTLGKGASLAFWYHMHGSGTGSLKVQFQFSPERPWITLWQQSGDMGNNWLSASLDLSYYAGPDRSLRFVAERGSGGTSDIAIDDISLNLGIVIGGGWVGSNSTAVITCASTSCGTNWSRWYGNMFSVNRSEYSGGESDLFDIVLQEVWDHTYQQAVQVQALILWQIAQLSTGDYIDFLGTFRIGSGRQQVSHGPGVLASHLPSQIILPAGEKRVHWSSDDRGTSEGWRFAVVPLGTLNPAVGQQFGVKIIGTGLTTSDRISVVEGHIACGSLGSASSTSRLSGSSVIGSKIGIPSALQHDDMSGLTALFWGDLKIATSLSVLGVGTYRVCWCADLADGCDVDGEFLVEAGTFAVNGPTAVQDGEFGGYLLAWIGKAFSLQIIGQGLVPGDRVTIISNTTQCGASGSESTTAALISGSVSGAGIPGTSGIASTSLRWDGLILNVYGTYRVCWCATKDWLPTDCDDASEFGTDVGTFQVKGSVHAETSGGGSGPGRGGDPDAGRGIGSMDQLFSPSQVVVSSTQSTSFGTHGYKDASTNAVFVSDTHNHRIVRYTSETSTKALTCSTSGCNSSVTFEVGGRRDCSLSAVLYVTDFREPDERVEWITVEGVVVTTDCSPGRQCEIQQTYSCLEDYDIARYISFQDTVEVSAKISNSVDACPKNGNLLHLEISMTCVTGISAPTTWIGGQQQGSGSSQLDTPEGIYLDESGQVWIADADNHRVSVWSADTAGSKQKSFATMSSFDPSVSKVSGRYALNMDATSVTGSVYKVSADNDGVLRWNRASLSWVCVAGCHGIGIETYQIHHVGGTYVDDVGEVLYVSDVNNHRVLRFGVNSWYVNCRFACGGLRVAGGYGPGKGAMQLLYPGAIFVTGSSDVYVVDVYNHRIQKWSAPSYPTGITVAGSSEGIPGEAHNRLHFPSSVFVDAGDTVYVFDHGNNRLMKWAVGASVGILTHGGEGQAPGIFNKDPQVSSSGGQDYKFSSVFDELHYPSSVFATSSSIYTTDFMDNRVQQRNLDGVIIRHIPTSATAVGSGQGELHYPGSLFVDASGNVYIADWANHRVQKYDIVGQSFSTVAGTGEPGREDNQLRFPYAIFVDRSSNLYVADTFNHRIMVWPSGATTGQVLVGMGADNQGDTDKELSFPIGLYIDYFGKLYVVDSRNHRVQTWSLAHQASVFQCSVGVICILRLPASGLYTSTSNKIKVHRSVRKCGDETDEDETDGYSDVLSSVMTGLDYNALVDPAKLGLYVLGIPTGYDTDSSFTVCWASNPSQDSDYMYSAGTLFLIGPQLDQHQSCTAGFSCRLGPFLGQGLTQTASIALVIEAGECGYDDRDPLIASNSYKSLTADAYVNLVEVDLPVGGIWRICFCTASYGGCDDFADFVSEAGLLTVKGPDDQHQDQSCYAEVQCTLGPFTGQGLTTNDGIVLVPATESCGTAPRDSSIASDTSLKVDEYFQSHLAGTELPYGGQWLMCYCTGSDACTGTNLTSQMGVFTVQIGVLTVRGPSPLDQHRNCTAGAHCVISGFTGQWLSTRDQISMVNQEGSCIFNDKDSTIMRNSYKQVEILTSSACTDPQVQNCQTEVNFLGVGSSNNALDGDLPKGGQWWICYCSNIEDCIDRSSYTVSVGNLTVKGPTPLTQDRTCVAGQTCVLDGISGQDLEDGDRIMILDTCGVPSVNLGYGNVGGLDNWPNQGISEGATIAGSRFSFTSIVPAIGSTYRLCWCPVGLTACSTADHFVVDQGSFTLVGPNPIALGPQTFSQDRTCVSGQTCVITGISGQNLANDDRFLLLDTCAAARARVPRLPDSGVTVTLTASGATLQWPGAFLSGMGGQYRLCWCAAGFGCNADELFRIDVGQFMLLGPRPLTQYRTCVSGQPCSWQISGEHLRDGDQIVALDTCGSTTPLPRWPNTGPSNNASSLGRVYSWGTVAVTASGGEYRLCWCSNGRDLVQHVGVRQQYSCSVTEQFRVDIGTLTMVGPGPTDAAEVGRWVGGSLHSTYFIQSRTCVAGLTCSLEGLTGNLLSDTDSLFVLETCGFHSTVPRFANSGMSNLVARSGAALWFGNVEVSSAGGVYQLCWCASGYTCTYGSDFKVTMAELHIVGPSPLEQDRTCVSGQTCLLESISGKDLMGGDTFFVLDTCGQNHMAGIASPIDRFPKAGYFESVASSGAMVSWGSIAVSAPGGQYRLCWCAQAAAPCSTADHFKTDVGSFLLVGPKTEGNDKTCVAGQTCVLTGIMGQDLSTYDQYMVLDTCAAHPVIPKFPKSGLFSFVESNNATVSWGSAPLTVAGGQYRLCWCAGLFPQCSVTDNFQVDVGSFTFVGPSPLSQHQTCVAGQTCYFIISQVWGYLTMIPYSS